MKPSDDRTPTGSSQGFRPKTLRLPPSVGRRPGSVSSKVVLPAPFGPTRPTTSPARTSHRGTFSVKSPLRTTRSEAETRTSLDIGVFLTAEKPCYELPKRSAPQPEQARTVHRGRELRPGRGQCLVAGGRRGAVGDERPLALPGHDEPGCFEVGVRAARGDDRHAQPGGQVSHRGKLRPWRQLAPLQQVGELNRQSAGRTARRTRGSG